MSLPAPDESRRRRRIRPPDERLTMAGDLGGALYEMVVEQTTIRWPSPRYRQDPVGFFRDILGIEPWSVQERVLESIRDNPRTSWKSGHRVGKSNTAGGAALWFYCSHEDARVVMSAPTARPVDDILWRETKMMRARAGKCVACKREDPEDLRILRPCPHSAPIDGEMGELARTGIKSVDFREIKGFTAREVEAITGTAGKNLFFIFDECSGIADELFEGLEGNRAGYSRSGSGTVRVLYTGNPTRTSGEFYDSHNSKSKYFHCITTSSEESPNVVAGREVIPGLATREWVEEKREMWGESSPLFRVRVEGAYAEKEDGKIFSIHTIAQAEQRWHETTAEGRLYIGLDPAGASGTGDETVFVARRGLKALVIVAFLGLSEEAHAAHLLSLISTHKLARERPVVVMDREGSVGAKVYGLLVAMTAARTAPFELVGLRTSEKPQRQPLIYGLLRDELTANLEQWVRDGGSFPEDTKLAKELHEFEWEQDGKGGRLRCTSKKVIKKRLGRSPDRYDALALCCWEPLSLQEDGLTRSGKRALGLDEDHPGPTIDPYQGGVDPY